ncbi:MAG: GNAT family N-acetyltransferase [Alphaproteobacteria bacterium]|nr:GNAT family N-acetyltransferase [Alphaproteobacteria bacterium]
MTLQSPDHPGVRVRLARTPAEIQAAQHLRFKVFYEEYGAKADEKTLLSGLDIDDYDAYADHLIVTDGTNGSEKIVGTYRLLRQEAADEYGRFYSSTEYELAPLLNSGASLLELGRSCVLPEYRTRPVLQLLWQGIADFIMDRDIDLMFGCASLHSTDIQKLAPSLSYLHHYHLCPEPLRPRALGSRYVDMNIIPREDLDARQVFSALPPLIKGYLRVGATIGEGAVIDEQFNTTDVCIIVQTRQVTERYRKHYGRKIQKPMPGMDDPVSLQEAL